MSTTVMRANPGGQVPPSQIVGRDELIQRLWRVLARQSLVLSAERRIGKTSLMKKMIADARSAGEDDALLLVYHDLEGVRTRLEFVEILFHDVESHLSRLQRTATRAREILSHIGGGEVKGMIKLPSVAAAHWKDLLVGTIEDFMEHQERSLIFFWDEFSLLLYNIYQEEGVAAATELLDMLRFLRHMHPTLRMVYTGSVGLPNVIATFKRQGYANDPINDMYKMIVPALSHEYAVELARRLLVGEGIKTDDLENLAKVIATAVDDLPYYIHHVVDQLAFQGEPARAPDVDRIVAERLADPGDPWDLQHYLDRISTYYSNDHQPFALGLLDALAAVTEPIDFDNLFNGLKAIHVTEDRETARQVLTWLQRDHYVTQETDGCYRFVFPLVRRWWLLQRG